MRNLVKKKAIILFFCALLMVFASIVYSHCQIPCGIYDDQSRFDMIAENITTIEKSMKQIALLSQEQKPDMTRIVRWVENKEKHADDISHIVTYYFMAQRIKFADQADTASYKRYVNKLTLLHKMLVFNMKARQSADLSNVEKLKTLLAEFRTAYFKGSAHKH